MKLTPIEKEFESLLDSSINAIDKEFFDTCRPHPVRSIREWMEQELILPSGPHKGEPWSADTQPVQALLIDIMDSGLFTEHVSLGPSQSGKSQTGYIAPLLYHATELRETVVLGVPGGGMVSDKWADIVAVLDASPSLRQLIPKVGPGSKGGQVRDSVTLSNNVRLRFMTTGGKNTGRAGYTSRVIAVTEMGDFSATGKTNTEADPYRQLQGRQRSYKADKRRTYAEGTVTIEGHYPWAAKIGAAVALIVMPCPCCSEYVQLERENLKGWEEAHDAEEAKENAHLECPKCGGHISEDQRRAMVRAAKVIYEGQEIDRHGTVTGERPRSKKLWFRYNAAHNLLIEIGEIAAEEWQAKQHPPESKQRHEAERQLSQQVWAIPIKPAQIIELDADPEELAKRKSNTPRGVLPENCRFLGCGIDVGYRRLHLTTLAVTKDDQLRVIEHSIHETGYAQSGGGLDGKTAIRLALRELRDKLLEGYIEQGTGRLVKPDRVLVDGSFETDTIRAFVAETIDTEPDRIMSARGRGTNIEGGVYRCPMSPGKFTIDIAADQSQYTTLVGESVLIPEVVLNADVSKSRIQAATLAPANSPGALLLYDAPDREHISYCRALFSEKQVTEYTPSGKEITRFIQTGSKANHHLDSTSYSLAGLINAGWDYVEAQSKATDFAKVEAALRAMEDTKADVPAESSEREFITSRQVAPVSIERPEDDGEDDDNSGWGVSNDDYSNDPHAYLWD